jgi:hypothetical protein
MTNIMTGGPFFNACIESPDLRELNLSGRRFTWANSLDSPSFEQLDRLLMSTEWETKIPISDSSGTNKAYFRSCPVTPRLENICYSWKPKAFPI